MIDKINIGVLGCANVAKRLFIPNLLSSGLFNLVAVASRLPEKASHFSSLFNCEGLTGYSELLLRSDIQAIYIPLPTGLHFEWATKALLAGKHIIVEKSFSTKFFETKQIIELAKEKNLCVFENFMFVYHSQFDFVTKKISEGTIGDIRLLRSSFGFPPFDTNSNIRYQKDIGGGALLDAGAYTLMASQFFLGSNQEVLACSLENLNYQVDFQGSIMLKSSNGVVSQLAFGFDNFYQNNIELWGSKGKLIIERAFTAGPGYAPRILIEKENERNEYILPPDNHFHKILKRFYECIMSKNESCVFE
ncbi:MAG: Gfo/Idh/MocA family oxidoreductase, partial [Flavobacterium sp.]